MSWLQNSFGEFGKSVAGFMTFLGEADVLIALVFLFYFVIDKKFGKSLARTIITVGVFNTEIKNCVCRLRPYFVHDNVKCLKPVDSKADIYDVVAQGYSFPSGHASNSSATYGSVAAYSKRRWLKIVLYVIILLIGVSRFIVGVHYPTDVLAGWILGFACIFLTSFLEKKIPDKRIFYGVLIVLTIPGLFFCKTNDYFTGLGMLIGFAFADWFEEKYVKFETTKKPIRAILRVALSMGIFLGLNELLKLPFDKDFLASGSMSSLLVRSARYMIDVFVITAIYPMLFSLTDRIIARRNQKNS